MPDRWPHPRADTAGMHYPARCAHCGRVYDLAAVTVTARYADCSMWRAPCCGRLVDDRGVGWKPRADYVELDRDRRTRP